MSSIEAVPQTEAAAYSVPLCTHIMTSGVTCGSPAVKGTDLCYHHTALRAALDKNAHSAFAPIPYKFPEDRASLQIDYFILLQGFNEGRIDQRTAAFMLRILKAMAANLGKSGFLTEPRQPEPAPKPAENPIPCVRTSSKPAANPPQHDAPRPPATLTPASDDQSASTSATANPITHSLPTVQPSSTPAAPRSSQPPIETPQNHAELADNQPADRAHTSARPLLKLLD